MRWDFLLVWINALTGSLSSSNRGPVTLTGCLNCRNGLDDDSSYCPNCGQRARESKLTVWTLLSEFFSNVFDIDSSFYKSIYRLFFPGYLAKAFIQGSRKRYLNPIRFFLVAVVIFITILSSVVDIHDVVDEREDSIQDVGKSELLTSLNTWRDTIELKNAENELLNSVEKVVFKNINEVDSDYMDIDLVMFNFDFSKLKITKRDFLLAPIEEILEDQNIEGFWHQLQVSQVIKFTRKPESAMTFAIGNILWAVLCCIISMAFVLKLLYIRQGRYYVEHVILLFNIHTILFLGATSALIPYALNKEVNVGSYLPFLPLFVAIYIVWAMKSFYGQGLFKTLLKSLIGGIAYIAMFSLAVVFVLIISFLVF